MLNEPVRPSVLFSEEEYDMVAYTLVGLALIIAAGWRELSRYEAPR